MTTKRGSASGLRIRFHTRRLAGGLGTDSTSSSASRRVAPPESPRSICSSSLHSRRETPTTLGLLAIHGSHGASGIRRTQLALTVESQTSSLKSGQHKERKASMVMCDSRKRNQGVQGGSERPTRLKRATRTHLRALLAFQACPCLTWQCTLTASLSWNRQQASLDHHSKAAPCQGLSLP